MAFRNSYLSTSSTTTYPSTLSSFPPSSLGLTDSPSQLATLRTRLQPDGSYTPVAAPPKPLSQTQQLLSRAQAAQPEHARPKSSSNLRESFTAESDRVSALVHEWTAKSTPQAERIITKRPVAPDSPTRPRGAALRNPPSAPVLRRDINLKPQASASSLKSAASSVKVVAPTPTRTATPPTRQTPTSQPASTPTKAQARPPGDPPKTAPRPRVPVITVQAERDPPAVAIPRRLASKDRLAPAPAGRTKAKASDDSKPPARRVPADPRLADEWEAELVQSATRLTFAPPADPDADRRRRMDESWETRGMWDTGRDAAREAEDRVRREASREIARPPVTPRVPIRAAPTGVTSIHIGVRPRVHPDKAVDSVTRNQPDVGLPEPLFSPGPNDMPLPATPRPDSVKGSYNMRYERTLADKAKAEFEAWKERRAEREGGIAEGEEYRAGEWEPKDRVVARPAALQAMQPQTAPAGAHMQGGPTMAAPPLMPGMPGMQRAHSDGSHSGGPTTPTGAPMAVGDAGYAAQAQIQAQAHAAMVGDVGDGTAWPAYGYPYINQDGQEAYFDPSAMYGYWDPSYWWAMAMQNGMMPGMGMGGQGMESVQAGAEVASISDDAGSARSAKVQFVEQVKPSKSSKPSKPGKQPSAQDMAESFGYDPSSMGSYAYQPMMAGGMGGMSGMGAYGMMGYPYMANMGMGQMAGQGAQAGISQLGGQEALKPYDSGKLKQGRMGHYGYLEGRELAGPPPGHLPAGMQPQPSPASRPGMSPLTAQSAPQSQAGASMSAWGDQRIPSARYDGAANSVRYVQADLDTPYPRTKSGGMADGWTRYVNGEAVVGGDGVMRSRPYRDGRV
ncbi:hypothetical protein Q5752_002271 [Cryptotrichosporon argae]